MKNILFVFGMIGVTLFSCNSPKTGDTIDNNIISEEISIEAIDFDAILNIHWKLIALEGQPIERVENQEDEVYFTLHPEEHRLMGFSGCNTITGNYKLEAGHRIRFSNIASTLKSCPDVDIKESDFTKVFELADNYTIDGNKLSLNVGKRAPLAVFEAVDIK